MVGFAASTALCAIAGSIDALILGRVLQGLTACAEAVVGYAVIRELYSAAGAVRILAVYGMAIALAPAIGPVVGGHMHVWFGWRSNFVLLPETLVKPDRHALRPDTSRSLFPRNEFVRLQIRITAGQGRTTPRKLLST